MPRMPRKPAFLDPLYVYCAVIFFQNQESLLSRGLTVSLIQNDFAELDIHNSQMGANKTVTPRGVRLPKSCARAEQENPAVTVKQF